MPPEPIRDSVPPPRFRRRAIVSVLWALALGAATTVAIAWALAFSVNTIYHPGHLSMRRSPRVAWSVQDYASFGTLTEDWSPQLWNSVPMLSRMDELSEEFKEMVIRSISEMEQNITDLLNWPGTLVSESAPRVIQHERLLTPDGPSKLTEHLRGWPLLALGCARVVEPVPNASKDIGIVNDGWHWGIPFRDRQSASWDVDCLALPLKPLFPGFYLDTALFASLWWAALFWRPPDAVAVSPAASAPLAPTPSQVSPQTQSIVPNADARSRPRTILPPRCLDAPLPRCLPAVPLFRPTGLLLCCTPGAC